LLKDSGCEVLINPKSQTEFHKNLWTTDNDNVFPFETNDENVNMTTARINIQA